MIKLNCIGHLGQDAIINDVNGKRVVNFSLAHTEKFKDQSGNEIHKTIWISCAYWNERSQVAQYLKKGTQVYIEGQPDIKLYKTNSGETKSNITCRVSQIQLLGGGNKEGGSNQPPSSSQPKEGKYTSFDNETSQEPVDDLPF